MSDPYAPKENDLVAKYKPLMAKLTLSSMMGYCTAVAAKRIGTAVAFVAGVGFIALQGLVYAGVAELDWKEAEKGIVKAIDTVSFDLVYAYKIFVDIIEGRRYCFFIQLKVATTRRTNVCKYTLDASLYFIGW
jgi:uncharacterized membrane protein (Fun14 family)